MIQQVVDFLATIGAEVETLIHPDAIILPNFPRSIQLDYYSCGTKSVYCILQYYGIRVSVKKVERILHTNEDGTAVSDIKRVFKRYHLNCRTLQRPGLKDLAYAVRKGFPVLVSLHSGEHFAVVYGFCSGYVFVMNSSLDFMGDGVGNLWCAVSKSEFRGAWDRWGIEVAQ